MISSHRLVAAVAVAVALAAGPTIADWNVGREYYSQGRYADAAVHFHAMVKSNPNWPSGYLMLGRSQLALDQYDEALENLRTATELEALGDAKGVAALADRRESMGREIAGIEGNLSEVRAALCR